MRCFKAPKRGVDTERYHAIGNAVCVPVAEWVAKRINSTIKDVRVLRRGGTVTEKRLRALSEELSDERARCFSISHDSLPPKWASGGVAYKKWLVDAPFSSAPCRPIMSKFSSVVEEHPVDDRYYISPNAAQGIARRVDKLGRSLFPPLDSAIRHLASTLDGEVHRNDALAEAA